MSALAFTRQGSGAPLVLLHALGLTRQSWDPVLPALAEHFDVIAVDLPGFGDSAPLPDDVEPSPQALAAAVDGLLNDLGVRSPHVVGNSIGGWVALELAGIRPPMSVTLLSPAGLWRRGTPLYNRISLRATHWFAAHLAGVLSRVVKFRLGRLMVLGQTHGRPSRVTPDRARLAIHTIGTSPGFDAAFAATRPRHYVAAGPIDAPVTVAFGSRDLLLRRRSRRLDELPAHTQVEKLRRCGHIPMTDDPSAVSTLIIKSAGRDLYSSATALANAAMDGNSQSGLTGAAG